tara:strand:- start:31 stop:324 length:294 start_codon:yes stop_codon:yes gene_type:complete
MGQRARIYRPAKTAMQSGRSNTHKWVLEFERDGIDETDSLMGWSGSNDTNRQIKLKFSSKSAAIAFAHKQQLAYELIEPKRRLVPNKSYADNFAYKG